MAEESFLLMSLSDSKSKKLAQVISNDTSRKILEYLTKKNATETELAKDLSIPLSTVHYNLKHLLKAKLVKSDEYHYSKKGKEVNHYALANKYIIITPGKVSGIRSKLKSILPVGIMVVATAGLLQFLPGFTTQSSTAGLMADAQKEMVRGTVMEASAPAMQQNIIQNTVQNPLMQNIGLWFLTGALFAILAFFLFEWIRSRK